MPIVSAGFVTTEQLSGSDALIAYGPTILVDAGFEDGFDYAAFIKDGGTPPKSALQNVPALVDTGATQSCIDEDLAKQLNLPLVDRQKIGGVGGMHEVPVHLAHISVPSLGGFMQWGLFMSVKLSVSGQPHQVLIGRTFLQTMMMIYDGRDGSVSIAR